MSPFECRCIFKRVSKVRESYLQEIFKRVSKVRESYLQEIFKRVSKVREFYFQEASQKVRHSQSPGLFTLAWKKRKKRKVIQVHLANDDPIAALEDAMSVLKNNPDDFTSLCIKVSF